jgi:hypothetical protein
MVIFTFILEMLGLMSVAATVLQDIQVAQAAKAQRVTLDQLAPQV